MTLYQTLSRPLTGSRTVVGSDPSKPAGSYWVEKLGTVGRDTKVNVPREEASPARAPRRARQK